MTCENAFSDLMGAPKKVKREKRDTLIPLG